MKMLTTRKLFRKVPVHVVDHGQEIYQPAGPEGVVLGAWACSSHGTSSIALDSLDVIIKLRLPTGHTRAIFCRLLVVCDISSLFPTVPATFGIRPYTAEIEVET